MIDVRIPYLPNKQLGSAYNKIMQSTQSEWVLLLDHDVFLLNSEWYSICLEAIQQATADVGWIACMTNRIQCPSQKADFDSDDIAALSEYSKKLFKQHGNILTDITEDCKKQKPSGFFILTNKKAWEKVGGFKDGFLSIDNQYSDALIQNGYRIMLLKGLFVYHRYWRDWKK